ncbi:hypothetical protein GCM10010210_28650 [Pseudonocardia hydrocarbonoxydans]|uniref:Uncharacterized protein n=1 Tax=Pseudonocardia hydrocarbonoxydans TaxID=76726 RepID=A0A4Y3WHY4_9PSEU|nr:hypothetical protein PHY01_08550 [Pseudonocardia hydrocarbonoxydans]
MGAVTGAAGAAATRMSGTARGVRFGAPAADDHRSGEGPRATGAGGRAATGGWGEPGGPGLR